jgi:hypothetical protein
MQVETYLSPLDRPLNMVVHGLVFSDLAFTNENQHISVKQPCGGYELKA